MKEGQRLAIVEQQCTINDDYCEEKYYGYGCEGCRYYDWKIVSFINTDTNEGE